MHRLLAQNREMLVMIQKLMTQVSDNHAKEFSEPLNQKWILSELSPCATVLSSSNLFQDSTGGNLGSTNNMDFNSQIFDNMNIENSPGHPTAITCPSSSSPSKLSFDDIISRNHMQGNALSTISENTSTPNASLNNHIDLSFTMDEKDTNPFVAAPPLTTKMNTNRGHHLTTNSNNNNNNMTEI